MKKILSTLLLTLAVAVGPALPAHAEIDTLDHVPAATLLLPYFEVNLLAPNGTQTSFNLVNIDGSARLAHVTLWTDRGVPTHSFDVGLDAYGMAEVDLRQLFVFGLQPQTASAFSGCGVALPPARLDAATLAALQNAHTGQASSLLGGDCGGASHGDSSARGYVTVDVTSACTTTFPTSASYFTTIALLDNVLWGDYSIFDRANGITHADALVPLEASDSAPETADGGDYTFYAHRVEANADDHRERLGQYWFGRFINDGTHSTEAIVWRDPGAATSFPCGAPPAGLGAISVVPFDDHEQADLIAEPTTLPLATQKVDVATAFDTGMDAGFIAYDLGTGGSTFGGASQAFVSHVYRSATSGGQSTAWPLPLEGVTSQVPNPPCNDGIDNDLDGSIDADDPGCGYGDGSSENPPCLDGLDNDTDGLIDAADPGCNLPGSIQEDPVCADGIDNDSDGLEDGADPGCQGPVFYTEDAECSDTIDNDTDGDIDVADAECYGPGDPSEVHSGQCNDGIDNDGDGLFDYPADPDCGFFSDQSEGIPCSNGTDDDADGEIDYPDDIGCTSPTDFNEANPQCSDGVDNDLDGVTDYPADAGCDSLADTSESNPCSDGLDNDSDGDIDFPDDVSCRDAAWTSESSQCSDGLNNDADAFVDTDDPGCEGPWSNSEWPECNDGLDNDSDGDIDLADTACSAPFDDDESDACRDGIDNDADGLIDHPNETGCVSADDWSEKSDCDDLEDNDRDGFVDLADAGCSSATDLNELANTTERGCSDGVDNDLDGVTDYPADPGCSSVYDNAEVN